jgi:hypothetical protein
MRAESAFPGAPTYTSRLRAFRTAVTTGDPVLKEVQDAVITMSLLDDIYRAARRPPGGNGG